MGKTKTYSKVEKTLKQNYGSVDYSGDNKQEQSLSNYTSNQMLNKKASHQILNSNYSNHSEAVTKEMKPKKPLKKNMSEEKHLKLNLDVNVNIHLKINKKSEFQPKKAIPTETETEHLH